MDEEKNYSRVNKYDKRRKTTKSITVLMFVAIGLVVLLIALLIFGGNDDGEENNKKDTEESSPNEEVTEGEQNSEENTEGEEGSTEDSDTSQDEDMNDASEENDNIVQREQIPEEDIENPNVIEAYTANWEPIGTVQEEPHTTVYDQESDDWKEMEEAIAYALKIEEDEFESLWIGNGGEQRVNGHVQSNITDEHYTVYLEWQENEGWQPIKVERVERFIHPDQAD